MITANQKATIIEVFGAHYAPKIIEHLNKKKIYNSVGNSYDRSGIFKIVSGERENITVELEISKLVAAEKRRLKRIEEKKNQNFNQ